MTNFNSHQLLFAKLLTNQDEKTIEEIIASLMVEFDITAEESIELVEQSLAQKIEMDSIVFLSSKGLEEENIEFFSWEKANKALRALGDNHDINGCVTEFKVTYKDGQNYTGLVCVRPNKDRDIGTYMYEHLMFISGTACPQNLIDEHGYKTAMWIYNNRLGTDEQKQRAINFMERYEIVEVEETFEVKEIVKEIVEPSLRLVSYLAQYQTVEDLSEYLVKEYGINVSKALELIASVQSVEVKETEIQSDDEDNLFGDVIHAYTREQAIQDGEQVLLSGKDADLAKEAGYQYPVFLTRSVNDLIERAVSNKKWGNDRIGVLWDIFTMGKANHNRVLDGATREFVVWINGAGRKKNFTMIIQVGPMDIDNPSPAITIMFPREM